MYKIDPQSWLWRRVEELVHSLHNSAASKMFKVDFNLFTYKFNWLFFVQIFENFTIVGVQISKGLNKCVPPSSSGPISSEHIKHVEIITQSSALLAGVLGRRGLMEVDVTLGNLVWSLTWQDHSRVSLLLYVLTHQIHAYGNKIMVNFQLT